MSLNNAPCLPFLDIKTLEQKIYDAEQKIHKAYKKNNGKLFISFSGGKDSTVLRDIALRLYPHLPVVFSNTTNEVKEVLDFVKKIPNVITVYPKIPFTEVVKRYGFPVVSKEVSQKVNNLKRTHGRTTRITRAFGDKKGNGKLSNKWQFLAEEEFNLTEQCCNILKKYPLERWAKEKGLKPIIALMSDESSLRKQLKLYGDDDGKKIYPLLKTGWEEEDIWAYASMYGIRFAECYYGRIVNVDGKPVYLEGRKRTGCEYCGFGITLEKKDRFERSRLLTPKRYEKMMSIENNGYRFDEVIEIVKNPVKSTKYGIFGTKHLKDIDYHSDNDKTAVLMCGESTVETKECPRCSSTDIVRSFGHYGNYADTPTKDKKHRRVFITSTQGYVCQECNATITDDFHLLNSKYLMTERLRRYIIKNIRKKSFIEIKEWCGADFEQILDVVSDYMKKEQEKKEKA